MRLLASAVLGLAALCSIAFELPPQVYRDMQKKAPEFLNIRVTSVKTMSTKMPKKRQTAVIATALVEKVIRSKTGLKKGQTITIRYVNEQFYEPIAGPSQVPILQEGQRVPAYLAQESPTSYKPAAGGYSFQTVK